MPVDGLSPRERGRRRTRTLARPSLCHAAPSPRPAPSERSSKLFSVGLLSPPALGCARRDVCACSCRRRPQARDGVRPRPGVPGGPAGVRQAAAG
eukprot:6021334-Prymnesium_polylepis.1